MLRPITIRHPLRPRQRSLMCARAADLFGLGDDAPPLAVAEDLALDIRRGDVALFVGPSGSGKTSLLRAAGEQLNAADAAALPLPDRPLIDCLDGTLEDRLGLLAGCGLGEARLMLRTPGELSDGQRHRFRIAFALGQHAAILLDEFTASLDRTLAKAVAFNVQRLARRRGATVLAATVHDDVIDDLNPSVLIRCHGDGAVECERRAVKKKSSRWPAGCGFPRAPSPTGRTSLGGITAATRSPS